jgi:hypothetical protein
MSDDFITRLERQLISAERRELTRRPAVRRFVQTRHAVTAPLAAVAAVALLALVFALIAGTLSREQEVARPAPKLIGVYPLATALSPLWTGYGSVWTSDPVREQVLRLDPRTHRVAARIPTGAESVVAVGAGGVWALAGDLQYRGDRGPVRVLRIDPRSNRVIARIPVSAPPGQRLVPYGLQVDGDAVWVTGSSGLLRVDASRNAAGRFVALAGEPRGVVIDGDGAWTLTRGGRLRRVDLRSGRVTFEDRLAAPPGSMLAGAPGALLLRTAADRLARVAEAGGKRLWTVRLGGELDVAVVGEHDTIWAHRSDGVLLRLDAETGRRTGALRLPRDRAAGIAEIGRELWVATASGSLAVATR